jgi:methylated-DNA-[protein]-cysteine S-methyltransferase
MTTVFTPWPSPIGDLLLVGEVPGGGPGAGLAAAESGPVDGPATLRGLYLPDHRRGPAVDSAWRCEPRAFARVGAALDEYFADGAIAFDLPLDLRGSDFQRAVWAMLRVIPPGETVTYAELARRIGRPGAARAVGSAVARNPVSIVVPCHRVVGSDGSLTGYAGGIDRKRWLLAHERGAVAHA